MENDYLIDRAKQRSESYTGIQGILIQDHAVTESMGPILIYTGRMSLEPGGCSLQDSGGEEITR